MSYFVLLAINIKTIFTQDLIQVQTFNNLTYFNEINSLNNI